MEIDLLKTFQRVATCGSITKAADDLYLSVSTVTGRIKVLEEEVGKPLFLRIGRKIELTEAGARFLNNVERFIDILQQGQNKIQVPGNTHAGDLNLAVTPIAASYLLPQLLKRFRETYPLINLKLVACPNYQVLNMLNNGKVEIGIVQDDVEEGGVSIQRWFKDEVIPVLPKKHPLTDKECLQPADLRAYPILGFACHTKEWSRIKQWFDSGKIEPYVIMEISQVETLKKFLEQFKAISFLPRITVLEELEEGELTTLKLFPSLKLQWKASFAYRSNIQLSRTAKTFVEFACQQVEGGIQ